MGLILCDNLNVDHPLFIPDMGLRVFSLEELCYVIHNYPLIAMDGLVNNRLMSFLKNDLHIGLQVMNLERGLGDWANHDDVLIAILNFSDYYSPSEVDEYKNQIAEIRKLPRYEFYRMKGDLLFTIKQYGKALSNYERSLYDSRDQNADENYYYRVYRNIGCTYANLYQLDAAYEAFMKASECSNDKDIHKKIYFLAKLQDSIEKKELYLANVNDAGESADWDREYEESMISSADEDYAPEIKALDLLDSVKKHIAIEHILNRWKRKYRNML